MKHIFLVITGLALALTACKKEPQPEIEDPYPSADVTVKFECNHEVDGEPLVFGKQYLNPNGDTFALKKFVYYLSNMQFVNADGSVAVNESYHLIDHAVESRRSFKVSIPAGGTFTSIRLTIGIDSTRNCSGVQSGALDPANGMFWTWNSGYIFLKAEGSSPSSQNKSFVLHVGGYSGDYKAQREVELPLPQPVVIAVGASPVIRLNVNINEMFRTPNIIDFKTQYYLMTPGPKVKPVADNYVDMIRVGSVQN